MDKSLFKFERPENEAPLSYAPGTKEREELQKELKRQSEMQVEIPLIIGGKEIKTGDLGDVVMPHDHKHVLGKYHKAGKKEVQMAIDAAMKAKEEWEHTPWIDRASIAMRVAELISIVSTRITWARFMQNSPSPLTELLTAQNTAR